MSVRLRFAACLALPLSLLAVFAHAKVPPPDPAAVAMIQELGLREGPVASRDLPGWSATPRVVVLRADAARLEALRKAAPAAAIVAASDDPAGLATQLATATAVFGACDPARLAAPRLHWFQSYPVGVERCVVVPAEASTADGRPWFVALPR